ncbi:HRDC-like protein [Limtongia smithiae]|uniref:HRDC-like protein n=1 Tax=Limtongia smithiae TaxID=1125753 RepID=UPI0034CFD3E6
MATRPRPRRVINGVTEDVDASTLKLGPEFAVSQINNDGVEEQLIALNLSEARLLMKAFMAQRRERNTGAATAAVSAGPSVDESNQDDDFEDDLSSDPIVRKTQEYLTVFALFRDEETVSAVERILKSPENADLHPFEIAQLGSLSCEDAEEAKTLIPSLAKKRTDQQLQDLLDDLRRFG